MSSSDDNRTAKATARRARRSIGLCGLGLATGAVALAAMTPAQAQVATDGVPFAQLQKQVNQLRDDLAQERTDRQTDVSALLAALEVERTARAAADTTLTDALGAERQARISADSELTTTVNNERDARTAADTTLTDALADETAARLSDDQRLAARVTALEDQSFTTTVRSREYDVPNNTEWWGIMSCEAGERVTGGGWLPNDDETPDLRYVQGTGPTGTNGWKVYFLNDSPTDWDGTIYAVCAPIS